MSDPFTSPYCWDVCVEDPYDRTRNIHDRIFYKLEDAESYCYANNLDTSIIRTYERDEDGEFNFSCPIE
tara:strand:- start:827 stop:1033 length:207 start_codon:yes stop_codon:yes gene_type:complete